MNRIRDRQAKNYLLFLTLYLFGLLALSALGGLLYGREARELLLSEQRALSSALLEQGIPAETIAAAFRTSAVTPEGAALLDKLGRTENTMLWLLPRVSRSTGKFLLSALLAALLMGALSLGAGALFLRRRERQYQAAADAVEKYARGEFTACLPGGMGTLYRLFSSVDALAAALRAKSEAEQRGKEFLRDSISDISHQLKTPLAALSLYMEIIRSEPDNARAAEEFSSKAMRALARMEELIQAILKTARLDAGGIVFAEENCNVALLVARAAEPFVTRARTEGKELVFSGGEKDVLCCDREWTAEAIGNLIKNALDHTQRGGRVSVCWEQTPVLLRVSVADDGDGIAAEDIHHIFKRFYRGASSSGIGLGLPLAKAIIEGQGGVLTVKSEKGRGAEFSASFLIACPSAAEGKLTKI